MEDVFPYVGATGEPYITTLDSPYPGYAVAIPHPDGSGKSVRRNFAGLAFCLDEYLKRAIAWRDRTYLKLYGDAPPRRTFHRTQKNSKTGVPGVRLVIRKVRSRHGAGLVREVPVVLAEVWLQPGRNGKRSGKSRSRQYSISKYGFEAALELAIAWRKNAQRALERGETL